MEGGVTEIVNYKLLLLETRVIQQIKKKMKKKRRKNKMQNLCWIIGTSGLGNGNGLGSGRRQDSEKEMQMRLHFLSTSQNYTTFTTGMDISKKLLYGYRRECRFEVLSEPNQVIFSSKETFPPHS